MVNAMENGDLNGNIDLIRNQFIHFYKEKRHCYLLVDEYYDS